MTTGHRKRYFEFKEDKSDKFWEATLEGATLTVRYGKIGAAGQSQAKTFSDAAVAARHAEKLVAEKAAKGYVEAGNSTPSEPAEAADKAVRALARQEAKAASPRPATLNSVKDPNTSPKVLLCWRRPKTEPLLRVVPTQN